jgi:hypothetical protein
MNGLSLDALNLSTAEHLLYTQAFHELAEVSEDNHECNPGDYNTHMALSIPEVKRWLGDHFCTISLGQIDQVSSHYCNLKSKSESLTLRCLADPTDDVCARELIGSYDRRSIFCGITHHNSCPSRCRCDCEVSFQARYVLTKYHYSLLP